MKNPSSRTQYLVLSISGRVPPINFYLFRSKLPAQYFVFHITVELERHIRYSNDQSWMCMLSHWDGQPLGWLGAKVNNQYCKLINTLLPIKNPRKLSIQALFINDSFFEILLNVCQFVPLALLANKYSFTLLTKGSIYEIHDTIKLEPQHIQTHFSRKCSYYSAIKTSSQEMGDWYGETKSGSNLTSYLELTQLNVSLPGDIDLSSYECKLTSSSHGSLLLFVTLIIMLKLVSECH